MTTPTYQAQRIRDGYWRVVSEAGSLDTGWRITSDVDLGFITIDPGPDSLTKTHKTMRAALAHVRDELHPRWSR